MEYQITVGLFSSENQMNLFLSRGACMNLFNQACDCQCYLDIGFSQLHTTGHRACALEKYGCGVLYSLFALFHCPYPRPPHLFLHTQSLALSPAISFPILILIAVDRLMPGPPQPPLGHFSTILVVLATSGFSSKSPITVHHMLTGCSLHAHCSPDIEPSTLYALLH